MDYFKDNEILEKYGLASMSLEPGEPMTMDTMYGPWSITGMTPRQWELVFRVDDVRYERLVSALRRSEEMTENAPSGPVLDDGRLFFEWELETPHGRYKIKHR